MIDIRQFTVDPLLAGVKFAGSSWNVWRIILAAAFGLKLTAAEEEIFRTLAGGRDLLKSPCKELHLYVGRRGGKDSIASAIAVYLACLVDWQLAIGEVGVVLVLAVDREQAKVAFRYVKGLLEASPMLSREIENITADRIVLKSGIEIVIGTTDHASVRGRTVVAMIGDEFAFVPADDATEVMRAVRPAMAGQSNAMMIIITTLYSRRGLTWDTFRQYFGISDPHTLVVKAATRDTNPTISEEFIAAELERDPAAARTEYLSEFRSDLEAFIDDELVDRATRPSARELPFIRKDEAGIEISRFAAVDVSGGRNDATAAAVAHRNGDRIIIDACRRWPSPHDPVQVASEVARFLSTYNLSNAIADQYGAELSRSIYAEAGVSLVSAALNRSEAYLAMLPLFTSSRIEIPDEPRLRTELLALERRTGRSGKDAVDHPPHGHDDLINAVALAAVAAAQRGHSDEPTLFISRNDSALMFDDLNLQGGSIKIPVIWIPQ
jgi:hypothetical protein